MQAQLKVWHMLIGFLISLVSSAALIFSTGVAQGANEATQNNEIKHNREDIIMVRENYNINQKEQKQQYDMIMNTLIDIKVSIENKQDRPK